MLKSLKDGSVKIDLEFNRKPEQREIRIKIKDSGVGFNHKGGVKVSPDGQEFKGRGMMLIRSICKEVNYNDVGNEVEVVFVW